ncbi:hypothetical protein SAMN04490193_1576 [Pseudomonas marginalis]|nr:hypothetical protein PspCFBP13509_26955 [Pseudomonas sp. CFBP13509]SEB56666.1 hypothetical protein SAMN04490193_1576 [Pseudomonas marginalis]
MQGVWEAAWKVVIHRENPGVHQLPQGLHTFQNAFRKDTPCVVANAHGVPELQKNSSPLISGGTRLAPQGLMCKDVAPDIVR